MGSSHIFLLLLGLPCCLGQTWGLRAGQSPHQRVLLPSKLPRRFSSAQTKSRLAFPPSFTPGSFSQARSAAFLPCAQSRQAALSAAHLRRLRAAVDFPRSSVSRPILNCRRVPYAAVNGHEGFGRLAPAATRLCGNKENRHERQTDLRDEGLKLLRLQKAPGKDWADEARLWTSDDDDAPTGVAARGAPPFRKTRKKLLLLAEALGFPHRENREAPGELRERSAQPESPAVAGVGRPAPRIRPSETPRRGNTQAHFVRQRSNSLNKRLLQTLHVKSRTRQDPALRCDAFNGAGATAEAKRPVKRAESAASQRRTPQKIPLRSSKSQSCARNLERPEEYYFGRTPPRRAANRRDRLVRRR